MKISKEKIKEIAGELECGLKVFIHRKNGELLMVPDDDLFLETGDEWDEEQNKLEENYPDYYEVEKWSSHEAFEIMSNFAEQLIDNPRLQERLFKALNRKKTFREFKYEIDNSGEYREQWFKFRDEAQQEIVERRLKYLDFFRRGSS